MIEKSMKVGESHDADAVLNLPPKVRLALRTVPPSSQAYAHVGKKCYFCRNLIDAKDAAPPNEVYAGRDGEASHGYCLKYVLEKYPNVPTTELRGKVVRLARHGRF